MGRSVDCINDVWNNVSNECLQWKDSVAGDNTSHNNEIFA